MTERFAQALFFAALKHKDQKRKGSSVPYIMHPMAVSSLVMQYGGNEDHAIAALLHDVVEDCGVSLDEIHERWGHRVKIFVDKLTCDKTGTVWEYHERHIESIRAYKDPDLTKIFLCDKLHNYKTIISELRRATLEGFEHESVFAKFNGGGAQVLWHAALISDRLCGLEYNELLSLEFKRTFRELLEVG
jgi:(p)ppGpp synthase/HD superfamily hydrolase